MDNIYLVGGYDLAKDETSKKVHELDKRNLRWLEVCDIPEDYTANISACVNGNYLDVMAGHGINGGQIGKFCHRFDLGTQDWISTNSSAFGLPCYVNSCVPYVTNPETSSESCFVSCTNILLSDGLFSSESNTTFSIVSSQTGKTNEVVELRFFQRSEMKIAAGPSGLFACGGFDETGLARPECYLLEKAGESNSKWRTRPMRPMSIPRGAHEIVSVGNGRNIFHLVALGGTWLFGGRHSYAHNEIYDFAIDQWSFLPAMSKRRRNFGATCRGGEIMVFGGFDGTEGIFFDSEAYDLREGKWRPGPALPGLLWNYAVA